MPPSPGWLRIMMNSNPPTKNKLTKTKKGIFPAADGGCCESIVYVKAVNVFADLRGGLFRID